MFLFVFNNIKTCQIINILNISTKRISEKVKLIQIETIFSKWDRVILYLGCFKKVNPAI